MSLPPNMRDQPVGRFRKWNMSCDCHHCRVIKEYRKRDRVGELRDYRRNG